MSGIYPLVATFACESSLSTAILTHGLLLFGRVPIHHWWYKALKSRVVQVKYEKKGLHCCGFRYQHTYNGKLTEGGGNFVCISTTVLKTSTSYGTGLVDSLMDPIVHTYLPVYMYVC